MTVCPTLMVSAPADFSVLLTAVAAVLPRMVLVEMAPAPATETGTFITQDCLTAYFASTRSGTNKIYTSTRTSPTDPWPTPTLITDFMAVGGNQEDPWLAPDQRTFMFVSDISGTKDVYVSAR